MMNIWGIEITFKNGICKRVCYTGEESSEIDVAKKLFSGNPEDFNALISSIKDETVTFFRKGDISSFDITKL